METSTEKSGDIGWRAFFAALALAVAVPLTLSMSIYGYSYYKQTLRYSELFAQMDIDQFESFNNLCDTFTRLSLREGWEDASKQWSELCLVRNKEFFQKYAR